MLELLYDHVIPISKDPDTKLCKMLGSWDLPLDQDILPPVGTEAALTSS